jgi:hypothetical protein
VKFRWLHVSPQDLGAAMDSFLNKDARPVPLGKPKIGYVLIVFPHDNSDHAQMMTNCNNDRCLLELQKACKVVGG